MTGSYMTGAGTHAAAKSENTESGMKLTDSIQIGKNTYRSMIDTYLQKFDPNPDDIPNKLRDVDEWLRRFNGVTMSQLRLNYLGRIFYLYTVTEGDDDNGVDRSSSDDTDS